MRRQIFEMVKLKENTIFCCNFSISFSPASDSKTPAKTPKVKLYYWMEVFFTINARKQPTEIGNLLPNLTSRLLLPQLLKQMFKVFKSETRKGDEFRYVPKLRSLDLFKSHNKAL